MKFEPSLPIAARAALDHRLLVEYSYQRREQRSGYVMADALAIALDKPRPWKIVTNAMNGEIMAIVPPARRQ